MFISPIQVAITLLVVVARSDAQLCPICGLVEASVKSYLESYRNSSAINPSVDIPKIETHVGEEGGATDLDISFTNFEVIGISGFDLSSVEFKYLNDKNNPGTLNITIFFPEIIITGENYKIFGIVADVLPLDADGPFEIKFTDVTLYGHGLYYFLDFYVDDVLAELTSETLTVNMVNILGDLSDAFNEMMSEIGLEILREFSGGLNKLVGNYLEKLLNNLLPGTPPGKSVHIRTDEVENGLKALVKAFISHGKKEM